MKRDVPRALLVSDVRGWAFDQNLQDLALYLKRDFDFEFWYVTDFLQKKYVPDLLSFDAIFTPFHRWEQINNLLPWHKNNILGSLRCSMMFPERNVSLPGPREAAIVAKYKSFHAVNQRNFEDYSALCNNVVLLTNPVNTRRFKDATEPKPTPVFCWNGNPNHRNNRLDVKGFSSIVQPVFHDNPALTLHVAKYGDASQLTPSEMPAFYRKASVAVCASLYEGASNSTMEAMAAGLMLVTTRCGNHEDIAIQQLKDGHESGILFFDRTKSGLARAIKSIERLSEAEIHHLGQLNRASIEKNWSWNVWAPLYKKFLMQGVGG